jgi:hypothetical protein
VVTADDSMEGTAAVPGDDLSPANWGRELGYPEWIKPFLPALHEGITIGNKYVSVPAPKVGLGRYISNPFTGYLMILRTRGRRGSPTGDRA